MKDTPAKPFRVVDMRATYGVDRVNLMHTTQDGAQFIVATLNTPRMPLNGYDILTTANQLARAPVMAEDIAAMSQVLAHLGQVLGVEPGDVGALIDAVHALKAATQVAA